MSTPELNCETLEIALLAAQGGLAALLPNGIVHFDKQVQTSATNIDRIVVQASPREIAVPGQRAGVPKLYAVNVKVTVMLVTNDPATMDAYIAAVEAANVDNPPAQVVTDAAAFFPNGGPLIDSTNEGDRTAEPNDRTRSKTFRFVFNA